MLRNISANVKKFKSQPVNLLRKSFQNFENNALQNLHLHYSNKLTNFVYEM